MEKSGARDFRSIDCGFDRQIEIHVYCTFILQTRGRWGVLKKSILVMPLKEETILSIYEEESVIPYFHVLVGESGENGFLPKIRPINMVYKYLNL